MKLRPKLGDLEPHKAYRAGVKPAPTKESENPMRRGGVYPHKR
jgi:hypothetical protein